MSDESGSASVTVPLVQQARDASELKFTLKAAGRDKIDRLALGRTCAVPCCPRSLAIGDDRTRSRSLATEAEAAYTSVDEDGFRR